MPVANFWPTNLGLRDMAMEIVNAEEGIEEEVIELS